MIRSFQDERSALVFRGLTPKGFPADLVGVARRKLRMIANAEVLEDLRVPPGNRLHALTGDRSGQHAIRINDQFRICFIWSDGGADNVGIVDYH